MALNVFVPKQIDAGETRVPLNPAVVKKLIGLGARIVIEADAGFGANHLDAEYEEAGAVMAQNEGRWRDADLVLTIGLPSAEHVAELRQGAILVGVLAPLKNVPIIKILAQNQVTSFSMEFIPRISRAQSMDVLSSQANMGGYMAAVIGARACPKMFPMMITAAGTIAPARVLVIGVGVAGLQAIATAKRLGAVVEAYDVRPAVKEQVQSLGARFVELPMESQDAETAGGYARQQTEEERQKQQELMADHVVGADVVISTAAIFGKPPPMLILQSVVEKMRPGSVIVDLAADSEVGRGNCELTQPNRQITTESGVIIDGTTNLPALVPVHASQAYANNMLAFIKEIIVDEQLKLNLEDEIQNGAVITHGGEVLNEMIANLLKEGA